MPACLATLKVKTAIVSALAYIVLVDKFDRSFELSTTTDAQGVATVDLTNANIFPSSFLNQHSGFYKLKVLDAARSAKVWNVNNTLYSFIEFKVCEMVPTPTDYLIEI